MRRYPIFVTVTLLMCCSFAFAEVEYFDIGRGPVPINVPESYDGESPMPLILALHGGFMTGEELEKQFLQFTSLSEEYGFLYTYPTAMKRENGPLWNEWGVAGPKPDDSGYLRDLIEYVQDNYAVNAQRIHVVGGSNGAGMTYRMACDHADLIASVMAYAGPMPVDPPPEITECAFSGPVHVLSIHGTSDDTILFDGGCTAPPGFCYASAPDRAETWAEHNGCDLEPDTSCPQLDLEASIPGDDSTVTKYETGCTPAGSSHLWAIQGGEHLPHLTDEFRYMVIEFLLDHPKPGPCPVDLDGSDAVDVGDLLQLLSAWGLCDDCPWNDCAADLDNSGAVDVADLLELLSAWGAC